MHTKKRFVATASAAAGLLVVLTGCGGASQDGGESGDDGIGPITFASGKDLTGAMPQLIEMWNEENPDQEVTFLELAASPDEQRTSFVQDFQAKSGNYDVVWGDVVWTSEFAAQGWLEELDADKVAGSDILPAAVESATYDGKVWAAPFMTNAGLFYYRSDLIETPPTTWEELDAACEIAAANDMDCYAGQFAQYEGLTVNVAEAINSAGGSFLSDDGQSVAVDSPEARAGLQHLVDMFQDGDIDPAGITYQEQESATAFLDGEVMFLRNWPYVYTAASEEGSEIAGKFGIAQMPGLDGYGVSSLGGINLGVSAFSKNKETAKAWVEWMQSDEAQRVLVSVMNQASVRSDLYTDPELVEVSPYLPTLQESLMSANPRPRTPNYNAVSLAIQENAYAALQGTVSVDEAITQMAADLERAIR